ncbi:MAG: DUF3788 family protein [Lachnospiraceae bacterium]|nr:DUF3788 family protein [Lachnospiraceae bacterium]
MTDIKDKTYCPTLEEIGECARIKTAYHCTEKIEFSSCSWENGWNVKFKKSGKSLSTVYPRDGYFTVLVVIGEKQKKALMILFAEAKAMIGRNNGGAI